MSIKIQQIYDASNQISGVGKIYAVMKEDRYHTTIEAERSLMRDMRLISVREGVK